MTGSSGPSSSLVPISIGYSVKVERPILISRGSATIRPVFQWIKTCIQKRYR